jgi:hypothetical protein
MRMVRPKLDTHQVTIAEEQDEYKPVTAAFVRHPAYADVQGFNSLVLAFRPNDEERARLAAGEDIYVSLLTFMQPMQPIIVGVGAEATAAIYDVGIEV